MLMQRIIFILLTTCLVTVPARGKYQKVIPSWSPDARCLDGSSPGIYIDYGTSSNEFLLFFMGGGYCAGIEISGTLQTCYQRTKTQFGSSDYLPDQFNGEGYLSSDPTVNPYYSHWIKVVINYCDGSIHQGFVKHPIKYKDTQLYFRGAANVRSILKYLVDEFKLDEAKRVMLTGVSAGAMATFMWADYVRSLLKYPQGLFNVIDSGIFLNQPSVQTGMLKLGVSFEKLYKVANADESTPLAACNIHFPGEEYKCFFIEYAFNFTADVPSLWVQSNYDAWSVPNILDVFCLNSTAHGYTLASCNTTQLADIREYRQKVVGLMEDMGKRERTSAWSIDCANHAYALLNNFFNSDAQRAGPEEETVMEAIRVVEQGGKVMDVDRIQWPNNVPCAY